MKQILSLLLAYVFFQTQCLALWGGPFENNQPQGALANANGTYSVVLSGKNLVGMMQFSVSDSSQSNGRFVVFVEGVLSSGVASGIADVASKTVAAAIGGGGAGASGGAEGMFTAKMRGYPQQILLEGKGTLFTPANVETTISTADVENEETGITIATSDQVTRTVTKFRVRGSRTSRTASSGAGTPGIPTPPPAAP